MNYSIQMYHAKDGLFFARTTGGVCLIKTTDGKMPGDANVAFEVTFTLNEWASVGGVVQHLHWTEDALTLEPMGLLEGKEGAK